MPALVETDRMVGNGCDRTLLRPGLVVVSKKVLVSTKTKTTVYEWRTKRDKKRRRQDSNLCPQRGTDF